METIEPRILLSHLLNSV
ncbi:LEPR-XLL domain-containing protein [bacterium]|nr:LEPR-XLL domain-containing protein [bacterium]